MAKIMVAEFNHLIPGMVKKCLQPIGHEVYTASHGEAAIEVWKQAQPDLLMTGIMLPGIDGYELIRQWKAEWSGSKPAVLIAGKGGQPVDTQLASQIGVDGVLNYPFKSVEVIELVDRVLDAATTTGSVTPMPATTPRPAPVSRPPAGGPHLGVRPSLSPKAPAAATLLRNLKQELAGEGLLDTGGTPRPASAPAARAAGAIAGAAESATASGARPGPAGRTLLSSVPPSPLPRSGDPAAQLREMLNAKFQEVTETIIRSLPAIVEKIVDEKLGRK